MPRESWKRYAGSARSRLRTKRVGAKPRRTRNAAGQSFASILHSAIIATDFAKAVPRARDRLFVLVKAMSSRGRRSAPRDLASGQSLPRYLEHTPASTA